MGAAFIPASIGGAAFAPVTAADIAKQFNEEDDKIYIPKGISSISEIKLDNGFTLSAWADWSVNRCQAHVRNSDSGLAFVVYYYYTREVVQFVIYTTEKRSFSFRVRNPRFSEIPEKYRPLFKSIIEKITPFLKENEDKFFELRDDNITNEELAKTLKEWKV